MIEPFIPILLQRITEAVPVAFSDKQRSERTVALARRSLVIEAERNLSVIRSCLGDQSKLSVKNEALICAVVSRLDVSIAIAISMELSSEFDVVARLDSKTETDLKRILTEKSLPGRSASRNRKEVKFSNLLDFIARKVPEMQILASLMKDPDFKPLCRLNWPIRIQNLSLVMEALVKVLRA